MLNLICFFLLNVQQNYRLEIIVLELIRVNILMQLMDCKQIQLNLYLGQISRRSPSHRSYLSFGSFRFDRKTKQKNEANLLNRRFIPEDQIKSAKKNLSNPLERLATIRGSGRAGKKKASNMAGCPDLDLSQKISSFRERDSRRKVQ